MHQNDTRTIEELIASQKPGYSLDQRFYTDDDIYELELEGVINRNWILAGHESELPTPGDFKVFNVANESAIIVRSKDGTIRAFANVCRHRGSRVCLESKGNAKNFACPYHGWTYDTDGKLIAARNMDNDFDASTHGLKSVSLDNLHGFLFLCFTDSPLSLEGCKKDLAEPMALFDMQGLKVAVRKDYSIRANYKLSIENYQECYHCATAPPESSLFLVYGNGGTRATIRNLLKGLLNNWSPRNRISHIGPGVVGRKNSIGTAKQPTDTHGATHPGSVLRPDVWAIFSVAP